MSRADHGWRVYHPARQTAILRRLKGEPETPAETRMVDEEIAELEALVKGRKRVRRLPSDRAERKAQKPLFRRPRR